MPAQEDRLLDAKQAANRIGVAEATIRKWLYQRRLPKVKVGARLVRVPLSAVEAVIVKGLPSA